MATDRSSNRQVAIAALLSFPPSIRTAALQDASLRQELSVSLDAVTRLEALNAEFRRSVLLDSIRQMLAGGVSEMEIESQDGLVWKVLHDPSTGIVVRGDAAVTSLPECACISPDVAVRTDWLDQQTRRYRISDRHITRWRTILAARPLDDDEFDQLLDEFRLTPAYVAVSIGERLRRGSFGAADLVPPDAKYYERLAGEPGNDIDIRTFVSSTVAKRVRTLVEGDATEGLKTALLLSSHSSIANIIDLNGVSADEVWRVFQWVAAYGDRISQLGAIECGLQALPVFPAIEPSLAEMVSAIAADNPDDPDGRLRLLSSLVALVEGEVGRRHIARGRQPFWRRLASIAHASLIERGVVAAKAGSARFNDWALASGGSLFYIQTLIDLRLEPRWLPDFISAQQLKAEFVSRVVGAAERHRENVPEGVLASLLFGAGSDAIQSQRVFPSAFLPGPLEGGIEAVLEIPAELNASVKAQLEAEELSPESFFGLVNSSLIFRIGPELSEMAAQGLRRVGYQLRKVSPSEDAFPLLHGLATVAAVTRSNELAKEVRILARGARRLGAKGLAPAAVAKIALVAAAANEDVTVWSNFIGNWFAELAFADMTRDEALALQAGLVQLLHVEPTLWETCGRAEAAITAFLAAFPDSPQEL